nr:hypothetical protein [Tanacetum cinerariifolium]
TTCCYITDSPGYIIESVPEKDPKEDDEDPEEDPVNYPIDRDDEDEEESSGDDADDEEENEDEEEEEEHLALADSVLPLAYRTIARMSIRAQTPIPFPSKTELDRLLAIPTLPPSLLTSYSSPLPQVLSPLLPISPTNAGAPLGYRAAMIRLRAESPSTSHPLPLPPPIVLPYTKAYMVMMRAVAPSTYILAPRPETPPSGTLPLLPIPLPTSSPPLLLPSTDCRADAPEVTLPPQKRLCISLGPRFEVEECLSTPTARPIGGFRDDRLLMSGQLNSLRRDRRFHARTARLMKSKVRASHEAWIQSIDASDMAHFEVRALQTTILAQQTEIEDLRAADRR